MNLAMKESGLRFMELELDAKALYDVVLTRDRRFDGRFFVAVRSTGIYCRPVCTVRPPRFENCTFHPTAASAEHAGFRPCLRCRPELAPGSSAPVDAVSRLAGLAIRRIEDGALTQMNLDELASEFGVTSRHLRRAIRNEAGLSPIELAQTARLLTAKQLLMDTTMSVTDVAYSSGFDSLRRFNATFKARYRLTPTSIRKSARIWQAGEADAYGFDLSVRPPFDWNAILSFLRLRVIPGIEQVQDLWYRRTVHVGNCHGWIAIGPGRSSHTVRLMVSTQLGPVLAKVLASVKAMLDARADPAAVSDRFSTDPLLAPLVKRWPGHRVPGTFNGFECALRAIVGQQITVRSAITLLGRLVVRYGKPITSPFEALTHSFPSPDAIVSVNTSQLQQIGLTTSRAETVRSLAKAVADGHLILEAGADPDRVRDALLDLPGIGEWTAEYILMRGIGWPDAFPVNDVGLRKASGLTPRLLRDRAEQWRPWRSYATVLLWQSLNASDELNNGADQ